MNGLLGPDGRPVYVAKRIESVTLYVVGFLHDSGWDFLGVFSDERVAEALCVTPNHFFAPATLDKPFPEGLQEWPGYTQPRLDARVARRAAQRAARHSA